MFQHNFADSRISEILRLEEYDSDDFLLYTDTVENIDLYLGMIDSETFSKSFDRNIHVVNIFIRQCRTAMRENPRIIEQFI